MLCWPLRYVIPRCVERGVGLGSDRLRIRPVPALAAAFGNLGILKSGDMAIPDMCYLLIQTLPTLATLANPRVASTSNTRRMRIENTARTCT